MKKKILFVYPELMMGGSTTSFISLLNSIDYNNYEVDLILYNKRGTYLKDIPVHVNVLKEAAIYPANSKLSKYKKLKTFFFSGLFFKALFFEAIYKKKIGLNIQIMSQFHNKISRDLDKIYDVVIGYLELWADYYALEKVSAIKKISWIHIDYMSTGFVPSLDYKSFVKADKIVCVSKSCLDNFNKIFPDFFGKTVVLENILSSKFVKQRAADKEGFNQNLINYNGIKLITVCRLSVHTKGLDRAIIATKKLKEEGYNFKWFILGDGEDYNLIENMIEKNNITDRFILIGEKKNPYPYLKECDVYVMASRREGKPMSVTEAQILGLPIIVTNYSSAKEQVIHGEDGIIVDNIDEGIYLGIKEILDNPGLINKFKKNLLKRQLSNEDLIEDFYSIIK